MSQVVMQHVWHLRAGGGLTWAIFAPFCNCLNIGYTSFCEKNNWHKLISWRMCDTKMLRPSFYFFKFYFSNVNQKPLTLIESSLKNSFGTVVFQILYFCSPEFVPKTKIRTHSHTFTLYKHSWCGRFCMLGGEREKES